MRGIRRCTGSSAYERRTYNAFLAQHADTARPETSVTVSGTAYSAGENRKRQKSMGERCCPPPRGGEVTWTVNLAEAGLYRIEVEYYPLSGDGQRHRAQRRADQRRTAVH